MTSTVDVAEVIEGQGLGRFTLGLMLASLLVIFFDGYDMTVISFASKDLMREFHLSKVLLAQVFSAGILGTLVSGLLFGFVADRIGRRPAIIVSTASFGVLTLALGFAQSFGQLMILRLLDGLALGGAVPLLWALNIEFSPRRLRARVITIIMLGYGLGVMACGPLARLLIPRFGWPGVFWFGGLASLAVTLALLAVLPESLRFLTSKGAPAARIARLLKRLAPGYALPPEARFVLTDELTGVEVRRRFPLPLLFKGALKWITPFLWLGLIASSLSTYFLTTWGPLVLEDLGFGADGAAWVTAANSLCSALGGLIIMSFTDRKGPISIAVLPAVAVPLLLIAGLAPMGLKVFFVLGLVLSVFLGGAHYAIQSIVGIFYPSAYRASGSGWAGSVAKIGSIAAPQIGAVVLSTSLPLRQTYALLAACPAALCACVLVIGVLDRRLRRAGLDEGMAAAPAAAASALAGE
jgi:AAHS family 4-hydroxybenzoate transporter-like MFS transporter